MKKALTIKTLKGTEVTVNFERTIEEMKTRLDIDGEEYTQITKEERVNITATANDTEFELFHRHPNGYTESENKETNNAKDAKSFGLKNKETYAQMVVSNEDYEAIMKYWDITYNGGEELPKAIKTNEEYLRRIETGNIKEFATKEELVRYRRNYNNLHNEGGIGYVPDTTTTEEKEKVIKQIQHLKNLKEA